MKSYVMEPEGHRRSRVVRLSALLLLVTSVGCNSMGCTLATCTDVVVVSVTGNVLREYYVQMRVPGGDLVERFCTSGDCGSEVTFVGAPAGFELAILDTDRKELVRRTFEPEYEISYPNGESCSPECLVSRVTLNVW